jgi:hypothetical protein
MDELFIYLMIPPTLHSVVGKLLLVAILIVNMRCASKKLGLQSRKRLLRKLELFRLKRLAAGSSESKNHYFSSFFLFVDSQKKKKAKGKPTEKDLEQESLINEDQSG